MDDADLQPLPVDLAELADSMSFDADDYIYYLDTRTGKILFLPEKLQDYPDATEEELLQAVGLVLGDPSDLFECLEVTKDLDRYIPVEPIESWEAYGWMEDFAASVQDHALRTRLEDVLEGHRPFRGFKDTLLNDEAELERWYAFEAAARQEEARMWLAAQGFRAVPPPE